MSGSEPLLAETSGDWLDGRSSRPRRVRLRVVDGAVRRLELWSPDGDPGATPLPLRTLPLKSVQPSARLQGVPRLLTLLAGESVELADDDWVDRHWPRHHRIERWVHRLEGRMRWVMGLALAAVVGGVLLVQFGFPWLVARVADRVPWALERELGEQTLAILPRLGFKSTALRADRQDELQTLFKPLCAELPPGPACRLHFRAAAVPNAMALPGGEIVFTDSLVKLLQNDAQFIAIAGHEMGHVQGRHVLRSLITNASLLWLLTAAVGDVTAVAFGGGVGTLDVLQAAHSREQERAADAHAFVVLRAHGYSPTAFAEALERVAAARKDVGDSDYRDSHPGTAERAAAARAAAAGVESGP